MNHWGRIVLSLAALAAAGWIVAGAMGYRVDDDATLARHTLISFSALLALVLSQAWVGVYLLVLERLLRHTLDADSVRRRSLVRARRRGLFGAGCGILAPVAQFTSANALFPTRLDVRWHALAGLASVLALAVALGFERSALRAAGVVASSPAE